MGDEHSVHILIGGQLVKDRHVQPIHTRPARTEATRRHPGRAAPAAAAPGNQRPPAGAAIEVDRTVDASGIIGLAGHDLLVGAHLAGHRITARLDGHFVHITTNGVLAKTLPSPVPLEQRGQLRGARLATAPVTAASTGPVRVERRVPAEGIVTVTRQRVRVGRTHAGKLVTILVEDTHLRVLHEGEELSLHPRPEKPTRHPVQGIQNHAVHKLIMSTMSR